MPKLSPWFNASLHAPVREGWYDCKECNTRHYFKAGVWYRGREPLREGPMTMHKMHWRGLTRPTLKSLLAEYDPTVPRSKDEKAWLDMAPVGREFGSPDYERLMQQDFERAIRAGIEDVKNGRIKPYKFGKTQKT
jgi:hypothetical protein